MKKIMVFAVLCISPYVNASAYIVWGTQLQVYAQSTSNSDANMIQSVNGIYGGGDHPWCVRRAYIDFADKEIFSAALAASSAKKSVNFIYEDAALPKNIAGHVSGLSCKVISIFE